MTWHPITDAQRNGRTIRIRDRRVPNDPPMVAVWAADDPAFPWHVMFLRTGETDHFADHPDLEWSTP